MPDPDYVANPGRISDLMERKSKPKASEKELEEVFGGRSAGLPGTTAGQSTPKINETGPGRSPKKGSKKGATPTPPSKNVDSEEE